MMGIHRSKSLPSSGRRTWLLGLFLLFLGLVAWRCWPSQVPLSDDGYELAIALYSVCNQRSEERLQKIELLLRDMHGENRGNAASIAELEVIVGMASAGDWDAAMQACRQTLQDQVRS